MNISNNSGMAKNIRLKISGHIEGNYKLTERDFGHTTTKTTYFYHDY